MRGPLARSVVTAAAGAGALVARRVVEHGWRAVRGDHPPTAAGVDDEADLAELLLWAALAAAAVTVAERTATRIAQRALEGRIRR